MGRGGCVGCNSEEEEVSSESRTHLVIIAGITQRAIKQYGLGCIKIT
jgi:hypothetical protein